MPVGLLRGTRGFASAHHEPGSLGKVGGQDYGFQR